MNPKKAKKNLRKCCISVGPFDLGLRRSEAIRRGEVTYNGCIYSLNTKTLMILIREKNWTSAAWRGMVGNLIVSFWGKRPLSGAVLRLMASTLSPQRVRKLSKSFSNKSIFLVSWTWKFFGKLMGVWVPRMLRTPIKKKHSHVSRFKAKVLVGCQRCASCNGQFYNPLQQGSFFSPYPRHSRGVFLKNLHACMWIPTVVSQVNRPCIKSLALYIHQI